MPLRRRTLRKPPLVSCIMPTGNRSNLASQAVRYFQNQDYNNRELIIVCDGVESCENLIAGDDRIRLVRLSRHYSIGAKRNLACAHAHGEIIMLWDDDDWYGRERISYQTKPLLTDRVDVTALSSCIFYCVASRQFWMCDLSLHNKMFAHGVVGGTIAFWKELWERETRFPDSSLAEDASFLSDAIRRRARLKKLANKGMFVYIRHHSNSWHFTPGSFLEESGWNRVRPPSFMSQQDLDFYRSLNHF